jgi:hypothetical protein
MDSGRGRGGSEGAMAKHTHYLELARQARRASDEVATQHNLQHAEHWYYTVMADRRTGNDRRASRFVHPLLRYITLVMFPSRRASKLGVAAFHGR